MRKESYKGSQPYDNVTEVETRGSVRWSKFFIRPDVYVLDPVTGEPVTLRDYLKISNGLVPIREVLDNDDEIIRTGARASLELLNLRPGISNAKANAVELIRFRRAYSITMAGKITEEKMRVDVTKMFEATIQALQANPEFSENYKILRYGVGYNINLVDPFMKVDQAAKKEDWRGGNYRDITVYSGRVKLRTDREDLFGFVGNTAVSYMRIQDVDADALRQLVFDILDKSSGKVIRRSWDLKTPKTTYQKGSEVLGEAGDAYRYDPNLKFRRLKGIEGRIAELAADSEKFLALKSEQTLWNHVKVAGYIADSFKENLTGVITSRSWQAQEFSTQAILRNAKALLDTNKSLGTKDKEAIIKRLNAVLLSTKKEDMAKVAMFKSRANTSLEGKNKRAVETIQKMKEADLKNLAGTDLEDLLFNASLSTEELVMMFPSKLAELGESDKLNFTYSYLSMSPEQRVQLVLGLNFKLFRKGGAFASREPKKRPQIVTEVMDGKAKIVAVGDIKYPDGKDFLYNQLREVEVWSKDEARYVPWLEIQEVDYSGSIKGTGASRNAGKGIVVTTRRLGIGPSGQLEHIPRPIVGEIDSPTRVESAIFIPYGMGPEGVIDPITALKDSLEVEVAKLPAGHRLKTSMYNIGKLTDRYSLQNIKMNPSVRAELAAHSGKSSDYILGLAQRARPEDIKLLESMKFMIDLQGVEGQISGFEVDLRRILVKATNNYGVEGRFIRDGSGKLRPYSAQEIRALAELMFIRTERTYESTEEAGKDLARLAHIEPFVYGVKPTESEFSYLTKRTRLGSKGYVPIHQSDDAYWSVKRQLKNLGYSHTLTEPIDMLVAVGDIELTPEEMADMKHLYDRGNKDFKPIGPGEGQFWVSRNTERRISEAIDATAGDISPVMDKKKGYVVEHTYKNRAGETVKGYVKEGRNNFRVLTDETGMTRIVPWVMPHADMIEEIMADGSKRELAAIVSLDEIISKGPGLEALRRVAVEAGEASEKLFHEAVANNWQ